MMVEVNAGERELVMREFEQIKFDVQDWAHLEKCAISSSSQEKGDRISIHVYNASRHINVVKTLTSQQSACLRQCFLAAETDSWTDPFLHEHLLLDRYSWTLGVYAGERYYMCFGCNTIPSLLKDLLTKIEEFGLPSLLDDDGSPYFCLDKCV